MVHLDIAAVLQGHPVSILQSHNNEHGKTSVVPKLESNKHSTHSISVNSPSPLFIRQKEESFVVSSNDFVTA